MVDVALYEAIFAMMESMVPEFDVFGFIRERTGNIMPGITPPPSTPAPMAATYRSAPTATRSSAASCRPSAATTWPATRDWPATTARCAPRRTLWGYRPLGRLAAPGGSAGGAGASRSPGQPHLLRRRHVPRSAIPCPRDVLSARLPDGKPFRMPGIVPKLSATPGSADWVGPNWASIPMPCSPSWATTARASPPCAGKAPSERYAEPFIGAPRTGRPLSPIQQGRRGYPHASTSMAPSGKSRCTDARLRPDRPMRNAPSNETALARRIQQHVIPLAEGRQHVFLHPPDQHLQFPANGLHGILEIAFVVQLHLGDDPLQQGFPCGSTSVTTRPPSGRGWLRVKGWGAKASASRCFRLSKSGLLFRRIRLVKDRKTRIGFVDASIYRTNGSIWRKAMCRRK